ncbi:putative monovalent cation/H+ antiporter subunit G [Corynebacterium renale]|uniref:Multicomponent Na+:H+ antiporter subunit G n=1 Tax=Corynebacterium renale TaxID=1724 RepID=A0A2A9DPQ9_9CORY|nr:monovalent cation/H(+) antiporter subunit G [Corynebacterium renale]PFG27972.1 multicomponent Na+:H+ antiporter subunit G [Corynebacterium renale]SQG63305.1 putative monovalent cation/H+ antiporter subunit G [Corynebacterium renale]SQI21504.1 putative monovalent cation/H+ antiporter subunit G [Corynebacterium renale]STC99456.1 putative monovalent cation/H+ antiporter subunit G [Corynebacterium renale]
MNWQLVTDIVSLVFILVGAFLVLSASIGLVRFKDTMSKIHIITKPQTTGLLLTVIGAIIRVAGSENFGVGQRGDMGILVLLILFTFVTNPVTAQRLGRVARREGLYGDRHRLSRNDAPAQRSLRNRRK